MASAEGGVITAAVLPGYEASRPEAGIELTPESIEQFIDAWEAKGRGQETLKWYDRGMRQLYDSLPADKRIRRGTLARWREELLEESYAPRTVNLFISVANTYLEYMGYREFQLVRQLKPEPKEPLSELTRSEYLRLLQTARLQRRERAYLLVKLFATADLPVQELAKLTVEAAKAGEVEVVSGGLSQRVELPEFLCRELLDYARRENILSGPVFLDRNGGPMSRTNVSSTIRRLCAPARVAEEKGNPRCLRRLYRATRAEIESNVAELIRQSYNWLLEQEQHAVGWENSHL